MAEDLFFKALVGQKTIIVDVMPKKSKSDDSKKEKLKQILELLKFVLTLDDEELVKSTVESIIDLLEDEINKGK